MDNKEKREFINQLVNTIKDDILSRVDAMPGYWSGVELREYIKDKFTDCACHDFKIGKTKRKYKNELLTNGGL